jgi:hypothetical protein
MTTTGSRDASSSYGKCNGATGNVRTSVTPLMSTIVGWKIDREAIASSQKSRSSQNFNRAATKILTKLQSRRHKSFEKPAIV